MKQLRILRLSALTAVLAATSLCVSAAENTSPNAGPASMAAAAVDPMALGDVDRDLVFTPVTPCRLLDTRVAGGIFAAGSTRDFMGFTASDFLSQGGADGNCGIPIDAAAIAVNLAMVNPAQAGYATVYPFGEERPLAASINFIAGATLSNEIVVPLAQAGDWDFSLYSHREAHAVADVSGYYMRPNATGLDCTHVEQRPSVAAGASADEFIACPAGSAATGGTCTAGSGLGAARDLVIIASEPSVSNSAQWYCNVYNDGAVTHSFRQMARCCRVPGR